MSEEGEVPEVGPTETPEFEIQAGMPIYVMPTEEGKPPRALLIFGVALTEEGPAPMGEEVSWSQDMGAWMTTDRGPVPTDLGEQITAHARELGVRAFL